MKWGDIWNHFEETPIPLCKYCGMTIGQKKGSTTNMWSHLKSHHGHLLVFFKEGKNRFARLRSGDDQCSVEDAIHHVQGCDSIAETITSPPAGEDELVADDITALGTDHHYNLVDLLTKMIVFVKEDQILLRQVIRLLKLVNCGNTPLEETLREVESLKNHFNERERMELLEYLPRLEETLVRKFQSASENNAEQRTSPSKHGEAVLFITSLILDLVSNEALLVDLIKVILVASKEDFRLEDLKQSATQLKEAMVSDSRGELTDTVDWCIELIAGSFQATEETEEMVPLAVETVEPDDGGSAGAHSPYGHESGDTPSTSDENVEVNETIPSQGLVPAAIECYPADFEGKLCKDLINYVLGPTPTDIFASQDGEVEPAFFYLPTPKHPGTDPLLSGNKTDELAEIGELESSSLYSHSKIYAQQTVDDPEEESNDLVLAGPSTPRKFSSTIEMPEERKEDAPTPMPEECTPRKLPFDCKLSANKVDDLTAKRMSRYDVHQLPANAPHGLKKWSSQLSGVHANNPENAQLRDFRPKPSASASITGPPTKRQRSPPPQVVSRHSAKVKVSCKKTSKKGKGKVCRRMTDHHKKVSSGKTNSLQRDRREELPTQDAGEEPTRKKKKGMEDTVGAAGVSGCEGRRRQPAPWTLVKND